ncbi:uncharacterized protein LACBIDRAFT_322457 [Laccaria bicolor S238N-H82]|uniref:Predicted protein n=1 Tax=Laccaria bicolor (strain S238N-H82 / ATCC MYA-4686) TaxID=486041 RepID=B0CWC8_LACBS|nr:uncharacterized protein LACBIDRAFT_322457 [Laccaria bicolor S238N-H82]EDR13486.1 predicted protein [Laccaria bicolor S238N-H82]|eukprot:XP_001875984.1 predicted protein [Laccaria bicolor S238N-H82]
MERTKNCDKDVDKANTIISGMQDLKADACSAKFMDKTGKTLACVFSHRMQMNDQATVERKGRGERTAYPGPHKRMLKDVQASKSEDQHWDGIPLNITNVHKNFTSFWPLTPTKGDIQHPNQSVMAYSLEPPPDCPEDVEYIRDGMGECFKVAFPNYYSQYKAAFAAGAWMTEDPGPWLGRAMVWKFPVETHVDSLDDGTSLLSPTYSYRTPTGFLESYWTGLGLGQISCWLITIQILYPSPSGILVNSYWNDPKPPGIVEFCWIFKEWV